MSFTPYINSSRLERAITFARPRHLQCLASSQRTPKDPRSYASIEDLRRELEQSKGQAPFSITRAIQWLSEATNNGGGGLAFKAYRWVLGMDISPGWRRPADIDSGILLKIEAETDPGVLGRLQSLLLIPRRAVIKLLQRCPAAADLSQSELMRRIVDLKSIFPSADVARMMELLPSAFLSGDFRDWELTVAQVERATEILRKGLPSVNVDAMVEMDPTILFEDLRSLNEGIFNLRDLWKVDAVTLANSEPEELALAIRALGLKGPPTGV